MLTKAEAESPLWQRIKAKLHARLQGLRMQNDAVGLTLEQTQFLRGRIAELKLLDELDKPPPQVPRED